MTATVFVLDTNVFIEAHRRYYAFDLVPGFWDALVECARHGAIKSIDRVEDELKRGGETGKHDALALWAHEHAEDIFMTTDDAVVVAAYAEIVDWVQGQSQYMDAAKEDFAAGADGWAIAFAKATGRTVVTLEASSPLSRSRVKIPDVCRGVHVSYVDTFEMLRQLDVKLR